MSYPDQVKVVDTWMRQLAVRVKAEVQWNLDHPDGQAAEFNEDNECGLREASAYLCSAGAFVSLAWFTLASRRLNIARNKASSDGE